MSDGIHIVPAKVFNVIGVRIGTLPLVLREFNLVGTDETSNFGKRMAFDYFLWNDGTRERDVS